MRVGLLTTSFPLPDYPVSGIFVERLVRNLAKHAQIQVLTPAPDTETPLPAPADYDIACFRYAPRKWRRLAHKPGGIPAALKTNRWLLALIPVLLISKFIACLRVFAGMDVIHANWAASGAIAGAAGRFVKIPVITTLRGSDVARAHKNLIDRFFLKICLLTSRRIICVTESMRRELLALAPNAAEKLSVITNGIDQMFIDSFALHHANNDKFRFVTVGNLIPSKAVADIVTAFRDADLGNAELTIIGDGPEKTSLENLVTEYGLSDRVHLLGALAPDAIPAALTHSDAFVFASRSEGRPNALLEAMASGLPIAASRIPGVTDLITHGENGLLFEPGNCEQLADCLRQLASQPDLRRQLGQAAHRFVIREGLTWERTAANYLAAYRSVITA